MKPLKMVSSEDAKFTGWRLTLTSVAGIPMEALQGSRTCVFVGSFVKGKAP